MSFIYVTYLRHDCSVVLARKYNTPVTQALIIVSELNVDLAFLSFQSRSSLIPLNSDPPTSEPRSSAATVILWKQ